jgi:hypothetical protein
MFASPKGRLSAILCLFEYYDFCQSRQMISKVPDFRKHLTSAQSAKDFGPIRLLKLSPLACQV